jgi:hypothetical protein
MDAPMLAGYRSLSEPGPLNAKCEGAGGAGGEIDGAAGCPFRFARVSADGGPSPSSSSSPSAAACPFAAAAAGAAAVAAAAAAAAAAARSSSPASSTGCPFAAAAARPNPTTNPNPWQSRLRRPTVDGEAARLTRRALRAQNRSFPLSEVARHRFADDGWIAVGGRVFDITEHVVRHKGWETGCGMTEVLSILAHLGSDCTSEFGEIHRCYPAAFAQLKAYDIGALAGGGA